MIYFSKKLVSAIVAKLFCIILKFKIISVSRYLTRTLQKKDMELEYVEYRSGNGYY